MKSKIIYWGIVLILMIPLAQCSDENTDGPNIPDVKGVPTEIRMQVKSANNVTRASESVTDEEAAFDDKNLRLYVFDENGNIEYLDDKMTLTPDPNPSNPSYYDMTITAGKKYFYLFADSNEDTSYKMPTRKQLERQILTATYEVDNNGLTYLPDLAGNGDRNFFMGTLWSEIIEILPDRDKITEPVILDIGRITAKVKLHSVEKDKDNSGYSVMKGTFNPIGYRIAGAATETYLVGQYTGDAPPGTYTSVTSALHAFDTPEDKFASLKKWQPITALPPNDAAVNADHFYILENTTEKNANGYQFWFNTSHIRLKTEYTPHATELFKLDLKTQGTLRQDKTFWSIIIDGTRWLLEEDPTSQLTPDAETKIKKYESGINYHKFPIQDMNPRHNKDIVKTNAVLRNHYYEIAVTGIRDLGEPTDEEDTITPIPIDVDIRINVNVIDWSKISQNTKI